MLKRREVMVTAATTVFAAGLTKNGLGNPAAMINGKAATVSLRQQAIDACAASRDRCRELLHHSHLRTNQSVSFRCRETLDHCRQLVRLLKTNGSMQAALCQVCADSCIRTADVLADQTGNQPLGTYVTDLRHCASVCLQLMLNDSGIVSRPVK